MCVRSVVVTLASPFLSSFTFPRTVFWGDSTVKLTLPEVIGASVLAFSTVAVRVTLDPVIAVLNDD
jgi:hypothetical protein